MKTLKTVEEFKNAEPGVYRVEGEAAEQFAKDFEMSLVWAKNAKITIKDNQRKEGFFQRIQSAIEAREMKRKQAQFDAGYGYAAAKLLRQGDAVVHELEGSVAASHAFNEYDDFDKGIIEALKDFKLLQLSMF